jgi:nucleotide-binding universal stress UspA family protein
MENILVPCDFSKPAEEAFKFAVRMVRQSKGVVHVLNVIDISFMNGHSSLDNSYAFNLNFLKEMEQEVEKRFTVLRDQWAPGMVNVKFKHVISSLTSEVENYIRENDIDLVVMGTSGTGGAVIGSNTGRVIRHSAVPVISIHETSEKDIKHIVFPVLPDHNSKPLVDEVKKLQHFFNAELHLLYVNTPLFLKPDRDAKKALEDFVREFDIRNCSLNLRADLSVEEGIVHFSKEIHADLIAMGTHAWKGFWHLLIGSVAEDVANRFPAPVWTCAIR